MPKRMPRTTHAARCGITREQVERYRRDPMAFVEDLKIVSGRGECRFGDVMADFQRARYLDLLPALKAVAVGKEPVRRKHWWEATKGAGKDSDLAAALLWLLLFARRPLLVQVGAADKGQAAELQDAADFLLARNEWLKDRISSKLYALENSSNGARAEIISADIAGSHGSRPDVLILNELHAITKREFCENMMDNAAKMPFGVVVIATNAGIRQTWQWKWREQYRQDAESREKGGPGEWVFHCLRRPAPWLSESDLKDAQRRNTLKRYLRLFFGQWASPGGDAFSEEDIEAAVTLKGPVLHPEQGWLYGAGLDLGIKHDHAALVTVGARVGGGRIRVVKSQRWKPRLDTGEVDLIAVREAVLAEYREFGLGWVGYDPTQAVLMAQELRRHEVPMIEVQFRGQNLDLMARSLMTAFRSRVIDLYRDAELINDIYRLSVEERRMGGYKLTAVSDDEGHADAGIALSIVVPVMLDVANAEPEEETGGMPDRVVVY